MNEEDWEEWEGWEGWDWWDKWDWWDEWERCKNEIIWLAPVVVNDNCEIISFALGMCKERRVLAC